jgi:hypothetical protein
VDEWNSSLVIPQFYVQHDVPKNTESVSTCF